MLCLPTDLVAKIDMIDQWQATAHSFAPHFHSLLLTYTRGPQASSKTLPPLALDTTSFHDSLLTVTKTAVKSILPRSLSTIS